MATHFSCLENPMDTGAWRVTVHGITKNQTQLFFCDAGDIAMAKTALSPAPLGLIVRYCVSIWQGWEVGRGRIDHHQTVTALPPVRAGIREAWRKVSGP